MFRPGIYLVSDERFMPWPQLLEMIPALVEAGCTMIQVRHKRASTRQLLNRTESLLARTEGLSTTVVVNDRLDVAQAAGAKAVHLGQDDLPITKARTLLGPTATIGASVEVGTDLEAFETATYLAASPVFETKTKDDTSSPFGLSGLKALAKESRKPIVAIGGINPGNARQVASHGADSLAVISSVLGAPDPVEAVRALALAFEQGRGTRS